MISSTPPILHPLADVQSGLIGSGTHIAQYSVILPGSRIGSGCRVGAHCWVGDGVVLGDSVVLHHGVHVADGTTIETDVVVGPRVAFAPADPSAIPPQAPTRVRRGANIGTGSTIHPGIEVGSNAVIAPGSVVVRSVPPNAIVRGNPAQIVEYVRAAPAGGGRRSNPAHPTPESRVVGVTLSELPRFEDIRGSLVVGEFQRSVPFAVRRFFTVFGVPSTETRGEHAHRVCHQFLICLNGSCSVVVDDGDNRQEFQLDRPNLGLYLPPMVWGIQYRYTSDAVVLVFASHLYDAEDYIRDYDEFLRLRQAT